MTDNNKRQDQELKELRGLVYNHVATTEKDIGTLRADLAEVKTNVGWLMRTHWILVGGVVGILIKLFIK